MRAWRILTHGEPKKVLSLETVPTPTPDSGQLRVRVIAVACNFADVLLCRGEYQVKPATPVTPGLELCGVVEQVGAGVSPTLLGTRVVGQSSLPDGGFAEFALLDASSAFEVPSGIASTAAASLHLTYLTPWLGLHRRAAVRTAETLVVTAAAGGVGTAAVQLGLAVGNDVIGIVSDEDKAATVRELGARHVINRNRADVVRTVLEITEERGADVVFESAGGNGYEQATKYIAFEGRILVVGFASGTIPQPRLNHALIKNYSILGLHWSLYLRHQPDIVRMAQAEIFNLATTQHIHPLIDQWATMDEVPYTLRDLASGVTRGKAVVRVRG